MQEIIGPKKSTDFSGISKNWPKNFKTVKKEQQEHVEEIAVEDYDSLTEECVNNTVTDLDENVQGEIIIEF